MTLIARELFPIHLKHGRLLRGGGEIGAADAAGKTAQLGIEPGRPAQPVLTSSRQFQLDDLSLNPPQFLIEFPSKGQNRRRGLFVLVGFAKIEDLLSQPFHLINHVDDEIAHFTKL